MYRVVRIGTADTAWKDEQLDFTGQARISHRPPSAEAFSAGLQDAPAEIITSDVMIADMEVEIKELSASIEAKREIHSVKWRKWDKKCGFWRAECERKKSSTPFSVKLC